eukprot:15476255-Alexandrium_andersonii.AAC.1
MPISRSLGNVPAAEQGSVHRSEEDLVVDGGCRGDAELALAPPTELGPPMFLTGWRCCADVRVLVALAGAHTCTRACTSPRVRPQVHEHRHTLAEGCLRAPMELHQQVTHTHSHLQKRTYTPKHAHVQAQSLQARGCEGKGLAVLLEPNGATLANRFDTCAYACACAAVHPRTHTHIRIPLPFWPKCRAKICALRFGTECAVMNTWRTTHGLESQDPFACVCLSPRE